MDVCPECGYEEEIDYGPPMTQEDWDIMKKESPLKYATMRHRADQMLKEVSSAGKLAEYIYGKDNET